jgi:hypothetical protein
MIKPLSLNPYDDLLQAVRIETTRSDNKHRYGTGFPHLFCEKKIDDKIIGIPAIVTNKHVIDDAQYGTFFINKRDSKRECNFGDKVEIKFERKDWIDHPDENLDLSVLPLVPKFEQMDIDLNNLFINYYNTFVPSRDTWEMFSPVEDIVTIGFPNGFWDQYNNAPIARKGVTATHPELNYMGKEAFWIDITIYPGMSGSPVFILGYGLEFYKTGGTSHGAKTYFLGVLSKMGKYIKHKPGIEISYISTNNLDNNVLSVISSLGYVIKATELKDFDTILAR